ncbi:MAG: hypothetical protein QOE83_337 [Actinomycetota bacterium]|nr:hypothetical protein [Actinomycetota bacterium]
MNGYDFSYKEGWAVVDAPSFKITVLENRVLVVGSGYEIEREAPWRSLNAWDVHRSELKGATENDVRSLLSKIVPPQAIDATTVALFQARPIAPNAE